MNASSYTEIKNTDQRTLAWNNDRLIEQETTYSSKPSFTWLSVRNHERYIMTISTMTP